MICASCIRKYQSAPSVTISTDSASTTMVVEVITIDDDDDENDVSITTTSRKKRKVVVNIPSSFSPVGAPSRKKIDKNLYNSFTISLLRRKMEQ